MDQKTEERKRSKLPIKHFLISLIIGLYTLYLIDYRWGSYGATSDFLVPPIFTQSNLLFSLWFVPFMLMYFLSLRKVSKVAFKRSE
jgi:Zn-dependent protease with chaperone function